MVIVRERPKILTTSERLIEANMKKRLDESVLMPGDIIFTTSNALLSKKVRIATKSDISHSMIYVSHCSVIHAVGEGVRGQNTQSIIFDPDSPVYVKRLKQGLHQDTATRICDYVRNIVGSEYSVKEALKAGMGVGDKFSSKQFCSRLIAQAYHRFGYELVDNQNYCTPADLLWSEMLAEIAQPTKDVSDDEARFWEEENNDADIAQSAMDRVLTCIRAIDPSVQTLNDIGRFVIRYPEHDSFVASSFEQSGYLDLWDHDLKEHPWRYDLQQMEREQSQPGVLAYCLGTMRAEPRDDNRFTKSLAGYQISNASCPRETFRRLIGLYTKLADLHARRIDTARQWLRKYPPALQP